jgi:hypothetical protein
MVGVALDVLEDGGGGDVCGVGLETVICIITEHDGGDVGVLEVVIVPFRRDPNGYELVD